MDRQRTTSALIIGTACCVFAGVWLTWLILGHRADFFDLLAVGSETSGEHLVTLARQGMNRSGPVRFTFCVFMVQIALAGVLIWAGVALLRCWPSARWSCIAFGVFAIATGLTDTVARLFYLTLPGELIKVSSFVMDAVVIVFALNLEGAMFALLMKPLSQEPMTPEEGM